MKYTLKNGVPHIEPVEIKNEQAKKILSSSSTQSVTKYLTSVHVTSEDENYILLDTPGFKDTEGAIVDIVNGI